MSGIPVKRKLQSKNNHNDDDESKDAKTINTNKHTVTDNVPNGSKTDKKETKTEECSSSRKETTKNTEMVYSSSLSIHNEQTLQYYLVLMFMTALAFATRLYKIDQPPWVCWDETHFGKMGSWYINNTFFFDVHPPLGKMLIGLSGYMTGYNGTFPFNKPGDEYGDTPYVGMRVFCACLGAALIPLVYMSTWLLCKSVTAALFASSFVLFDVGTNTLTRYILLDPILMFFIMLSTYTLLKFLSYREKSYTVGWWFWLSMTGVSLACGMGVKFVGLFVVLLAGYSTVDDLWRLLGNQKLPLFEIVKHFVARALCLIVLPILVYMVFFYIHLAVLNKSGSGDGFFSSQFQSQLRGNRLHNVSMPDRIAFGSLLTLKQQRIGGAYLHSHAHLYPEEHPPRQQQITTYSHKDDNNIWIMKPAFDDNDLSTPPIVVKDGDLVRLEHKVTGRNLHSHKEPAPVSQRHYQVSGYGTNGSGDANDIWEIVIPGAEAGSPVYAVRSKIRFVHYHVKCALFSDDRKLPKWGFEQLEATCNPDVKDKRTLWNIEEVIDPRLPNVSFEVHAPSFLQKFIESHQVMTQGNSGLKPKEGEITSRPWQWPINFKGQHFSGNDYKVYLLGNPVIWYGQLILMALFILMYMVHAVRLKRGVKMADGLKLYLDHMFTAGWWTIIGWALHYFPFWPMTRVLYFHHYFPALMYACMLGGITTDLAIKRISHCLPGPLSLTVFHLGVGAVLSIIAYSFYLFHPLSYGMSGPDAKQPDSMMYGLKWLDSWEF